MKKKTTQKKKKIEARPPSRSPYHPIMIDLSGMSDANALTILRALAEQEKGL